MSESKIDTSKIPTPGAATPANSGAQVIIGCKLANGFIMELVAQPEFKNGLMPAPTADRRIQINGANQARIARTNPGAHKFGITYVDESFARAWFKRNKDLLFVKNGSVFIVDDKDSFDGEVLDRAEVKTGIEPLDPLNDKRMKHGAQTDKDHLKRLGLTG